MRYSGIYYSLDFGKEFLFTEPVALALVRQRQGTAIFVYFFTSFNGFASS